MGVLTVVHPHPVPDNEAPSVVFRIRGPIVRADLPGLCDRVCRELAQHPDAQVFRCDVRGVEPDAVVVDALARLQLVTRRRSCVVLLVGASPALLDLVRLMGLEDVLPAATGEP